MPPHTSSLLFIKQEIKRPDFAHKQHTFFSFLKRCTSPAYPAPSVFFFGERERDMTGGGGEVTDVSLEDLRKKMVDFAKERDWEKYHTPRNLLLALVGEVGELSEIFQWRGEVPKGLPDWKEEDKQHLGEELSDVLLYLIQLSHYCGIDLGKAALRKVDLNAIKHPVDKYKVVVSTEEKSINNNVHNSEENA